MVETVVAAAVDCGCTPEQAVHVFRDIWYYTVGEILVRAHSDGRLAPPSTFFGGLDAAQLPLLAGIGDQWPALAARDTYRQGLRAFVDGLLPTKESPWTPA